VKNVDTSFELKSLSIRSVSLSSPVLESATEVEEMERSAESESLSSDFPFIAEKGLISNIKSVNTTSFSSAMVERTVPTGFILGDVKYRHGLVRIEELMFGF
jgi:hypothetical protein